MKELIFEDVLDRRANIGELLQTGTLRLLVFSDDQAHCVDKDALT